jgi:nitrate reductase cytochrome c-type subunit
MRRAALAILLLTLALATGVRGEDPSSPCGVADSDLSLVRVSVFATPTPPLYHAETSDPGEQPLPPRLRPGAPPRIPHGIADFLPITRTSNACLDCHQVREKVAGEATPIPPSHYVDLRNAPDRSGEAVTGARLVCVSCHVTRTDAPPLVEPPAPPPGAPPAP